MVLHHEMLKKKNIYIYTHTHPTLLQNCYSYNSTKWQLCVQTVKQEYVFNSSLDQELTYHSGKAWLRL
jgi:hypothetical protein